MRSNYFIPSGEPGSINDLAIRSLTNQDQVISEIMHSPKTCLNVISTLEQYIGQSTALIFAKRIIHYSLDNDDFQIDRIVSDTQKATH